MTRFPLEVERGEFGRGQNPAGAEIVGRGEWDASALGEPTGDFVFGDSGDQAHNSRLHCIEIDTAEDLQSARALSALLQDASRP